LRHKKGQNENEAKQRLPMRKGVMNIRELPRQNRYQVTVKRIKLANALSVFLVA